jgi:3-deoxy-D-manno-octulosonic-acid transferase
MHGASAGDLQALAPMMRLFRARFPDCRILVSTITDSGLLMARDRLAAELDAVVYAPWDLWGATRRAVRALAPDVLVLEYTELWPNLIHAVHAKGAKVVLTNGRFAAERVAGYRALFALTGNPLRELDLLLMREDDEAERALALGAPLERVWVTGNTKFDGLRATAPGGDEAELRSALGLSPGARLLIAGSTHEGEEDLLLGVFRGLLGQHPDLRLLLAPRYTDRAERVAALAEAAGCARRTRWCLRMRRSWCWAPSASWRAPTGSRRWSSSGEASPAAAGRTSSSRPRRGSRYSSDRTWTTSATACRCWWAGAASRCPTRATSRR